MATQELNRNDYTVAWICPLEVEQTAAILMLDHEHPRLINPRTDPNTYILGSIFGHNVVIASLPTAGNCPAATVVTQMKNTFPRLRFGLLVGIGGGVPTQTDDGPVRLGHVIVSKPAGQHSGTVQYDHGKAEAGKFFHTGYLAPPPTVLLSAAYMMGTRRSIAEKDPIEIHLERIDTSRHRLRKYRFPGRDEDHLYKTDYIHRDRHKSCQECGCDPSRRVSRLTEESDEEDDNTTCPKRVVVHRGTIASGEKVMRDGAQRDQLAKAYDVLCFEMEAAGALNDFPFLVIRGVSDYADSHKNNKWHGYAAAVAAAYARELFNHMPVEEVEHCRIASSDVQHMMNDIRNVAMTNEEAKVKSWLNPADPSSNLNEARTQHYEGTNLWFLQSEYYIQWKAKAKKALWVHGIPGCGKTILSSTVITDLKADRAPLLYYYFDFNHPNERTFEKLIRTIIYQLYQQAGGTRKYVEQLHTSCANGNKQPQIQTLTATLYSMIDATRDVQIVLDALDECSERKELLSWLASPTAQSVYLLFTSRSEQDIESSLLDWMKTEEIVPVQETPVDEDIRAVVRANIASDSDLSRWKSDPKTSAMIEDKLMSKAQGMFRWAICQLDALKQCLDLPSLEETLESLPDDLFKTYDRILRSLPDKHRRYAIRILQFLTFAKRPLRLQAMVDIVAVFPDRSPAFHERNRMPVPGEIARYCSSLTRIVVRKLSPKERSLYRNPPETITELQLAHFSVQEYLLSGYIEVSFESAFGIPHAFSCIAKVSLAYLKEAAEGQGTEGESSYPFAEYAAKFWTEYASYVEVADESVSDSAFELFTTQKCYDFWADLYHPLSHLDDIERHRPSALYYASLTGLPKTARRLLDHGADPNDKTLWFGPPLYDASENGHEEVVQLLLVRGANVNGRQARSSDVVLAAACRNGHIGVVKLLLDHGADVHDSSYAGINPLRAASEAGHEDIVQLLLQKSASLEDIGWAVDEALLAACQGGHERVVQLLLDEGADTEFCLSEEGGNALHNASYGGYEKVVQLLLNKGAHVNATSGFLGNSLQAACVGGHEKIMRLLLDNGADVNAEGGYYGSALQAACHEGYHEDVVQLLLDNGANINFQGGHLGSALQAACGGGSVQAVQLLLQNGANVNLEGGSYRSALQAACWGRSKEIVQLLLDRGADVNAQGGHFGTALQAASYQGSDEIIQLLLDNGADTNIQGGAYGSALLAACDHGHRNMKSVQLLLDNGANVNAQGGQYGNALQATCNVDCLDEAIVQLLLNHGANVNARGGYYGNALQAASYRGSECLVQLLLGYGADVNMKGGHYDNALQAACAAGCETVVQLLLDKGADVNAKGGAYRNTLKAACSSGHKGIVYRLLSRGADIDMKGGCYSVGLTNASPNDREEIEKLLINETLSRAAAWRERRRITGHIPQLET